MSAPSKIAWDAWRSSSCAVYTDRKGGDMAEWPEELRVREFPTGAE